MRPCPMVDVPEAIVELTKLEGVKSTHLNNPESAEQLVRKTIPFADAWKPVADEMYKDLPKKLKRRLNIISRLYLRSNNIVNR